MPKGKFELVFSGSVLVGKFPRYRRFHPSIESAQRTANAVWRKLNDKRNDGDARFDPAAFHPLLHGPGCDPSGSALRFPDPSAEDDRG